MENKSRGNWNAELHGIKAIITKDRDGNYILTGFDSRQKKEKSAEAIKAGIARYGTTPEFLDMYAQVGAVYSSYNQDISDLEKKQVKYNDPPNFTGCYTKKATELSFIFQSQVKSNSVAYDSNLCYKSVFVKDLGM